MAEAIRDVDLSATGLGPSDGWPDSLRTAADICLTSRFPMLVWWGPDLAMLYNDAFVPLIGGKHPDAIGRPGHEVFPEIWTVIGPMLQQVRDHGEATWSEDQLLVLDRHGFPEECYFTYSFSPVRDESGDVGGVFTAITETTDRVLVDRRLRTLGLLAEHTRDAETVHEAGQGAVQALASVPQDLPFAMLYLVDGSGVELVAATGDHPGRPGPLALDGDDPWQLGEVIGDAAPRLIDPAPGSSGRDAGGGNGAGPAAPSRAMTHPLLDAATGQAIGALVLGVSPRRPFDEEYRRFLALVAGQTAKGIIDARAAEVERDRVASLAELNRAKTEIFSNVSHEFRTPLTLLQGPLAEALADDEQPLPEGQRRRLTMAQRNAERMAKLVNALLDLSRLESGRINASYRATDLTTLTRELSSVFPSAVDRAGLGYDVDIEPLPQQVYVDREMWEKIVFNLLSNAIKFTFEGSISIRLRDGGDHAALDVVDSGVGIPEAELPYLFERFHRVRGTQARSQEGTGIGLALVRELVALHGGEVEVESEVGRGTRFTVTLPYGAAHLPDDQIDAEPALESTQVSASAYVDEVACWPTEQLQEQARRSEPGSTAGAHILVVDDNADMRTYLTRLLEVHWEVETAPDGEAALRAARRRRPELILSDVMMPRIDGFELLERLRADPTLSDIPLVLLSARASETSRVEGLDGGADDYLVKPFTVAELIARVRTNLRLAQQRTQTADIRARHAMLAGLSHEMQTPLAAILGSIAVIERGGSVPEDDQPALDIMRRQAGQLRGLVQQFLDYSRFEAGREPVLQPVAVTPAELVARATEACNSSRFRVDPGVGDLPAVLADVERATQIITNLCTNALKFSGEDQQVVVEGRRHGDAIAIDVRDRGIGVPPEEADLVFDKFYRGRSGRGVEGTGLGLHVSRALAEAMGGSLTLRTGEDGPGATFSLVLPVA